MILTFQKTLKQIIRPVAVSRIIAVSAALRGDMCQSAVCWVYGIGGETGYKWREPVSPLRLGWLAGCVAGAESAGASHGAGHLGGDRSAMPRAMLGREHPAANVAATTDSRHSWSM